MGVMGKIPTFRRSVGRRVRRSLGPRVRVRVGVKVWVGVNRVRVGVESDLALELGVESLN